MRELSTHGKASAHACERERERERERPGEREEHVPVALDIAPAQSRAQPPRDWSGVVDVARRRGRAGRQQRAHVVVAPVGEDVGGREECAVAQPPRPVVHDMCAKRGEDAGQCGGARLTVADEESLPGATIRTEATAAVPATANVEKPSDSLCRGGPVHTCNRADLEDGSRVERRVQQHCERHDGGRRSNRGSPTPRCLVSIVEFQNDPWVRSEQGDDFVITYAGKRRPRRVRGGMCRMRACPRVHCMKVCVYMCVRVCGCVSASACMLMLMLTEFASEGERSVAVVVGQIDVGATILEEYAHDCSVPLLRRHHQHRTPRRVARVEPDGDGGVGGCKQGSDLLLVPGKPRVGAERHRYRRGQGQGQGQDQGQGQGQGRLLP